MALDNEQLEFLAFGHPAIDRLVASCRERDFGGFTGIRHVRSDRVLDGMVFYFMATFRTVTETREIIPVAVVRGGDPDGDALDALESELCGQDFSGAPPGPDPRAAAIAADAGLYFARAVKRLDGKIAARKATMEENLDIGIDPEMDRIRDSYDSRIAELEEKLGLLEAQFKWYGRNMKGVITRTKNQIDKARSERDALLRKYRGYLGIGHDIELLCAGILLSRPA